MKKNVLYPLICLCLCWLLPACSDSGEEELKDYLTPDANSQAMFAQGISFTEAAQTQTLTFEAGNTWTATLEGENASAWCRISPTKGNAGKSTVSISAAQNETTQPRTATVTFSVGTLQKVISISQTAKEYVAPEGLSWSPEAPDADQALTLTYRAGSKSALYNSKEDLYVHIGVGTENGWEHVVTTWGKNEDKYKLKKEADNTWSLTLTPSIRQWMNSGELAVNQLALVIRNASADKQTEDLFVTVTDTKYKGFSPAAIVEKTMPAGLEEGINIIDSRTVTFVLRDKNTEGGHQEYAHIIGDFNRWTLANDETSQMYRDEAAGCWWITVSGLEAGKEYAFQYYLGTKENGSIRLGDPYCEKILDPDNDSYIPTATYSDNLTYPEGAKGVVSVFQMETSQGTSVSDFTMSHPDKLVIYELHLRDFTATGDLHGAKEKLTYLKEMGVNAIELMPVQEFSGNDSWGYNPIFYFAMDKAYGTKADYKDFIQACHEAGMAVILDVVYNQADKEFPFVKLYWDGSKPAANSPYFNTEAPHPYSVFYDFNHESDQVRAYVKRNLKFLLEEYQIDGFRFDLTKGFTQKKSTESTASNYDASRIAILKDYNAAIKAVKPDAFVILEHFCDTKEETELAADGMHLWRNMNNAYCQTAMSYSSDSDFSSMYTSTPAWVGFMESHDEERMGYKQTQWGATDALKKDVQTRMKQLEVNAAFALTVPGPKMIWQFGEMGYDISIEENGRTGRKPLHWEYLDNEYREALHDTYSKLLKLRNDYPELFDGTSDFSWKVGVSNWTNGRSLHIKSTTGKELVVLGNFTSTETSVSFPAQTGTWTDWKTGEDTQVEANMTVAGNSYQIYTRL